MTDTKPAHQGIFQRLSRRTWQRIGSLTMFVMAASPLPDLMARFAQDATAVSNPSLKPYEAPGLKLRSGFFTTKDANAAVSMPVR